MAALGDTYSNRLVDITFHTANSTAWTAPPSVWVGLCTAQPSATNMAECTVSNNYGRVQITWGSATNGSAAGPSASATFISASGTGWGDVKGYILCAASTGSTGSSQYMAYGAVSPTVNVAANDTVSFAANAMTMTFA